VIAKRWLYTNQVTNYQIFVIYSISVFFVVMDKNYKFVCESSGNHFIFSPTKIFQMKKINLLILLIGTTITLASAQDVKIKKGTVYINGNESVFIDEKSKNEFTLKSMEDEENLAIFKLIDPSLDYNPEFNDNYYLILFADHDGEAHYKEFRKLMAIKLLYSENVIVNGKVDIDNMNAFMEKYKPSVLPK